METVISRATCDEHRTFHFFFVFGNGVEKKELVRPVASRGQMKNAYMYTISAWKPI
jgi:hypothetical protein